jgi:NADH:ubiquinone oxidoreductase subunit 6 (subunit J)
LIGIFFSFILFIFILYFFILDKNFFILLNFFIDENPFYNFFILFFDNNNIKIISLVLYEDNFFILTILSLILLIAMIGSIVLTSRKTFFLKEQITFQQNRRFIKNAN